MRFGQRTLICAEMALVLACTSGKAFSKGTDAKADFFRHKLEAVQDCNKFAYGHPVDTLATKTKIEFLKKEIGTGNENWNAVHSYFKSNLDDAGYYSDEAPSPERTGKVQGFLSWLEKNSRLLDDFEKECMEGRVLLLPVFDSAGTKKSALSLFGFWLGAKYTESWTDSLFGRESYSGKLRIEETEGGAPTILFDKSKMSPLIDGSNIDIIVYSLGLGVHEGSHWIYSQTNEAAACVVQDKLALPIRISSIGGNTPDQFYLSGRRDFYDLYLKAKDGKTMGYGCESLAGEYAEFAVYPWLKKDVDAKDVNKMKSLSDYEPWSLGDLLGAASKKETRRIAAEICRRFAIEDKDVEARLKSVLDSMAAESGAGSSVGWKTLDRYVELMNQKFGKPGTEIWEKYALGQTHTLARQVKV